MYVKHNQKKKLGSLSFKEKKGKTQTIQLAMIKKNKNIDHEFWFLLYFFIQSRDIEIRPIRPTRLAKMLKIIFLAESVKIILMPNFNSTFGQDVHSYYHCFIPLQPSFLGSRNVGNVEISVGFAKSWKILPILHGDIKYNFHQSEKLYY